MASKPIDRKIKAATLVPLAILSAAWSASLANVSTATATSTTSTPVLLAELPDGSDVPSAPINAPASMPVPGVIATAVPSGNEDAVVNGATTSGIPGPALSAYQRGAQIINAADPTCNIPWELLAAIGRVESDHGQYGGNTLGEDGVSRPGVFGPVLDGTNGTQEILDTDAGELDGDPVYDRAVGPMQFLPSTWAAVKVDADGDGQRNPQDIDDAALATAVYLCSGNEDLSARSGQESAVFRYNRSQTYVDLVLRVMEAYSQGNYTAVPSGTYGGTVFTPSYTQAVKTTKRDAKAQAKQKTKQSAAKTTPKATGTTSKQSALPTTPSSTPSSSSPSSPTATPSAPKATPKAKNPVADMGKQASKAMEPVTKAVEQVTAPVEQALEPVVEAASGILTPLYGLFDSMSALMGFCVSRFPIISLLAPKAAKEKCMAKVGL